MPSVSTRFIYIHYTWSALDFRVFLFCFVSSGMSEMIADRRGQLLVLFSISYPPFHNVVYYIGLSWFSDNVYNTKNSAAVSLHEWYIIFVLFSSSCPTFVSSARYIPLATAKFPDASIRSRQIIPNELEQKHILYHALKRTKNTVSPAHPPRRVIGHKRAAVTIILYTVRI